MDNDIISKTLVLGIIFLFIGVGIASSASIKKNLNITKEEILNNPSISNNQIISSISLHTFDKTSSEQNKIVLTLENAEKITNILEELEYKIVFEPRSDETQALKIEFAELLDLHGLIPVGFSKDYILSLLNPSWLSDKPTMPKIITIPIFLSNFLGQFTNKLISLQQCYKNNYMKIVPKYSTTYISSSGTATATFCSISSAGSGTTLPLFLTPRPRVVALWTADNSFTTVGELLQSKGFFAYGAQTGSMLGFTGLGITFSFPGESIYGFIGYALFTSVTAEEIEWTNYKPVISEENPSNRDIDVSVSLSELSFRLDDPEGDKMSYTVSTTPNIGVGSGNNVGNGVYKVTVSGVDPNTEYTWHIEVNDGYNTVERDFTFTTEKEIPIISNPNPEDGDTWVSTDITQLSFRLDDFQGDLMDYTVITDPFIGSGSGNNVGNGVYTVDVSGLDYTTEYTWTVTVTDGAHSNEKIYIFKTQPVMVFNPFDEGWQYRKKITIDHDLITDDLVDFPVLISVVDSDLRDKAQNDGDDILFMDGTGIANRLVYENEYYDDSTGNLIAWVNIPSLSKNVDTVFYMYYGNSGCNNQEYPEIVWYSDYLAVWHMDGSTATKILDSTINGYDGTGDTGSPDYKSTGKIGYAIDFEETDTDCINMEKVVITGETSEITIECWGKLEDAGGVIIESYHNWETWGECFGFCDNEYKYHNWWDTPSITMMPAGEFAYNCWTYDGSGSEGASAYKNGNIVTVNNAIFHGGWTNSGENILTIGVGGNPLDYFDGIIDEIRISNIARSSTWIETSYNTMNDPSSFMSFGPEESNP